MEHQPHFLSEPLPQLLLSEVLANSSADGVPAFLLLSGSLCAAAFLGTVTVAVVGQGPPEDQSSTFPHL